MGARLSAGKHAPTRKGPIVRWDSVVGQCGGADVL